MAAKRRQAVVRERKSPKQARALDTREVIFEATARIIEEQDLSALYTNAIAARAGISIGTLYGHFPDKEAILVSMARRQLERDKEAILAAIAGERGPGASRARMAVRTLISLHRSRAKVRRTIMGVLAAQGLGGEAAAVVRNAADQIIAWRGKAGRPCVDETAMFLATRAIAGLLRAAFEEASPPLAAPEFEDELTAVAEGCFARARTSAICSDSQHLKAASAQIPNQATGRPSDRPRCNEPPAHSRG